MCVKPSPTGADTFGPRLPSFCIWWSCWYSTYSTFYMMNKTVKIIRNNNLFNEQNQIFYLSFQHIFSGNVGGSELESHHTFAEVVVFMFNTCSCWHLKHWYGGGDWPNIDRISSFNQPAIFLQTQLWQLHGKFKSHTLAHRYLGIEAPKAKIF